MAISEQENSLDSVLDNRSALDDAIASAGFDSLSEDNSTIEVADVSLLLNGEYSRSGDDLIISGANGKEVILEGYFNNPNPPALVAPNGAAIMPNTVEALLINIDPTMVAGPFTPGESFGEVIGRVEQINGVASVKGANGLTRVVKEGDPIYLNDVVKTADDSNIELRFQDDTSFSLASSGRAVVDSYTYDAATETGQFGATVISGMFRYASGLLGDEDADRAHTTIKTPSATLGVRGSEIDGNIQEDGGTTFVHKSGIIDVSDAFGLGTVTLTQPGTATSVSIEPGEPEPAFQAPAELLAQFAAALPEIAPTAGHAPKKAAKEGSEEEGAKLEGKEGEEEGEEEEGEETVEEAAEEAVQEEFTASTTEEAEEAEETEEEVANTAPTITANNLLTVAEGTLQKISPEDLGLQDTEGDPITLTLTKLPEYGTLYLGSDPDTRIELTLNAGSNSFSQADIAAGLLFYQHDGTEPLDVAAGDEFEFVASDGENTLPATTFNFEITHVNDAPIANNPLVDGLVENNDPNAGYADSTVLKAADFNIIDPDTPNLADMTVTIADDELPANGTLYLNGSAQTAGFSFNLVDDEVSYLFDASKGVEAGINTDSFTFSISDGETTTHGQEFTLHVGGTNDWPGLETNALTDINEGADVVITNSMLKLTDEESDPITIRVKSVTDGQLFRVENSQEVELTLNSTFKQSDIDNPNIEIVFRHNGNEPTADAGFQFDATDAADPDAADAHYIPAENFRFNVQNVNDAPILDQLSLLKVNTSNADDADGVKLNTVLKITDPDLNDIVTITIETQPAKGKIVDITATDPTAAISSFTLAQLDNGDIEYIFTDTITSDTEGTVTSPDEFTFSAKDASNEALTDQDGNPLPNQTLQIEASDTFIANKPPERDPDADFEAAINRDETSVTLTKADLNYIDPDNSPEPLVYTINSFVTGHGTLEIDGVAAQIGDTFTVADIEAGKIVYKHDGTHTTKDGFGFKVSDGSVTVTDEFIFNIGADYEANTLNLQTYSDYVQLGNVSEFNSLLSATNQEESFTIESWIKPNKTEVSNFEGQFFQQIFGTSSPDNNSELVGWNVGLDKDGGFVLRVAKTGAASDRFYGAIVPQDQNGIINYDSNGDWSIDQYWSHFSISVTKDLDGNITPTLYVSAEQDGEWITQEGIVMGAIELTDAIKVNPDDSSGNDYYIGGGLDLQLYNGSFVNSLKAFDGQLSDLRVWNTARTQEDIAADFKTRLDGSDPNLVGYWRLDNQEDDSLSIIKSDLSNTERSYHDRDGTTEHQGFLTGVKGDLEGLSNDSIDSNTQEPSKHPVGAWVSVSKAYERWDNGTFKLDDNGDKIVITKDVTAPIDEVMGHADVKDNIAAGAGDDILVYDSSDILIDGGTGQDTIRVSGDINITESTTRIIDPSEIKNIEVIDMEANDSTTDQLTLSADDVLSMTDNNSKLYVKGDSGDSVVISGLTATGSSETGYAAYSGSGATLLVDKDIAVTTE